VPPPVAADLAPDRDIAENDPSPFRVNKRQHLSTSVNIGVNIAGASCKHRRASHSATSGIGRCAVLAPRAVIGARNRASLCALHTPIHNSKE